MTDEPMTEPDPAAPDRHVDAEPSTDLVVPTAVRWSDRSDGGPAWPFARRRQLEQLRQNPAAMVAVSAAATVGSALVTAGLRRTLRQAPLSPAGRTASVAIGGYVVHEVHVVHHVVHHVIRPPAGAPAPDTCTAALPGASAGPRADPERLRPVAALRLGLRATSGIATAATSAAPPVRRCSTTGGAP